MFNPDCLQVFVFSSWKASDYRTPIVLDSGSTLKAGSADQDLPTAIFITVIGWPKYEVTPVWFSFWRDSVLLHLPYFDSSLHFLEMHVNIEGTSPQLFMKISCSNLLNLYVKGEVSDLLLVHYMFSYVLHPVYQCIFF